MVVSVLGCGWLGLPLAEHFIERGYTVKGSTTSAEKIAVLREKQIIPFRVKLTPGIENPDELQPFWDADVLVLNIPPGRGRDNLIEYHTRQIRAVLKAASKGGLHHIVFVSSTSVYPNRPGLVTETDARPGEAGRDSGNALLQTEQLLLNADNFETTVVRFGGLYGGVRHPAKYLAGRQNIGKAQAPVNLIHRDDCMAIITRIIEEQVTGEVFNAVADAHPSRQEYYTKAAAALGLEPPVFKEEEDDKTYKVVSNDKLKQQLAYRFIHPHLKVP